MDLIGRKQSIVKHAIIEENEEDKFSGSDSQGPTCQPARPRDATGCRPRRAAAAAAAAPASRRPRCARPRSCGARARTPRTAAGNAARPQTAPRASPPPCPRSSPRTERACSCTRSLRGRLVSFCGRNSLINRSTFFIQSTTK